MLVEIKIIIKFWRDKMSVEPEYIGIDETFSFSCNDSVSCFNKCCADVNQFLYPYDIVRLKNGLGITSGEFHKKYTMIYTGDTTGLPVVSFLTKPSNGHLCPFVEEKGCSVYNDRPASCRIFPLARAISRSRETGEITEHYALIKDPICEGFDNGDAIKVKDWIGTQELAEYNRYNDRMIELISLKHQVMPGALEGEYKDKFVMACYDVDEFRRQILDEGLIKESELEEGLYEKIKTDDYALLELGMNWIQKQLFGKIR